MNPAAETHPIEVDARGLRCPLPVIRLAEAARDAPAGSRIVVLATDPAARHDIPAWCRMRNCELTEVREITEARDSTETRDTTEARETTGLRDMTERSGSSWPDSGAQADPAYLRFVVRVRPQPPKADGSGSGSDRSSQAR